MQAPYLHIAFVCGSIPEDGKMPVEGLPNRVDVEGDTKKMSPFKLPIILFIGFVAGEYTGKAVISIQPVSPNEDTLPPHYSEVEFQESLNHRVYVSVKVEEFPVQQPGIYWFDVKLNGNPMARVPLEISYRRRMPKKPPSRRKKQVPLGFRKS